MGWTKSHIHPKCTKSLCWAGTLLDAAPSWLQCHSHRVTASTECWGQGLTPSQHPVPPRPHRGLCGAMLYSLGGTPVSPPSPEGVPELHRNGAHLLGFAVALHRRPGLAAEGAARPESEDGEELQEGSSGRGVHRTLGTPPGPHSWPGVPLALSHGRGGQGALPPRSCRPRAPAPGLPPAPGGGRNGGEMGQRGGGQTPGASPLRDPVACPALGVAASHPRKMSAALGKPPGQGTLWGHRAAPDTATGVSSPGQERSRLPHTPPARDIPALPRSSGAFAPVRSPWVFHPHPVSGCPCWGASSRPAATKTGGAWCLPGGTLRSCGVSAVGEAPSGSRHPKVHSLGPVGPVAGLPRASVSPVPEPTAHCVAVLQKCRPPRGPEIQSRSHS